MIDRRLFLQLLAGAMAGSVTAGGSKWIYDSFSLLHQDNFRVPSGKEHFGFALCQLCEGGCGLKVRKIDDRVVGMAGMPEHPVNKGGLCPVGLLSHIDLYHPLRLKRCMKRKGTSWQEITWDQALSEIIQKMIRSKNPWVWVGSENSVTVHALVRRMLSLQGSRHYYHAAQKDPFLYEPFQLSHGIEEAPFLDFEKTTTVFSFGDAFLEDFSAPPWIMRIYGNKRPDRSLLLYAGTGLSSTAQKADISLKANPGTLGFVALGIIYVILSQRMYDPLHLSKHSSDFKEFQDFVLGQYHLEMISRKTGIPVNLILKTTHQFLERKPSVAIAGDDLTQDINGSWSRAMIHALNMIAGSINSPGGIGVQESIPLAKLQPEIDEKMPQRPQSFPYGRLNELKKVDIVFLANANLMYHAPQPHLVQEWLDEVPLVVAFATHHLPSFQMAHYILPIHHFLEGLSDAGPPPWFPHTCLSVSLGVKKPHGESRDLGDLLLKMARATLPQGEQFFPWRNSRECAKELYSGLMAYAGMPFGSKEERLWYETLQVSGLWTPIYKNKEAFWKELISRGGWFRKVTLPQPWSKIFSQPDKGFRFQRLIHSEEPIFIGEESRYPLILQPLSVHYANQRSNHLPYLGLLNFPERDAQFSIPVIISPQEAKRLKLRDRDRALLITEGGKIEVLVLVHEGLRPGFAQVILGLSPRNNPHHLFTTNPEFPEGPLVFQRGRLERI